LRIPVLPFALGLYLPLSLSAATMVGGLVRAYVNRKSDNEHAQERGILLASGLIGGDAVIGVFIALGALSGLIPVDKPGILPSWVSFAAFIALGCGLSYYTLRKKNH